MTDEVGSTLGINILMDGIALGEIYEPVVPGATAETKSTTAQNNIKGIKTKNVGLIDHDAFKMKIQYTGSATQNTLLSKIYDRLVHTWAIVYPPTFHGGGHSVTFTGQLNGAKLVDIGTEAPHIELSSTTNSEPIAVTTWAAGLTTPFLSIADDDSNVLTPTPAAAAAVYEYEVEAYSDNTSITITPTATAGTIRVNDTIAATAVASGAIPLSGPVTMVSITAGELNKTARVYWLRVWKGSTNHP